MILWDMCPKCKVLQEGKKLGCTYKNIPGIAEAVAVVVSTWYQLILQQYRTHVFTYRKRGTGGLQGN